MSEPPPADLTAQPIGFFSGPLQNKISAPAIVHVAFWLVIAGTALTVAELALNLATAPWSVSGSYAILVTSLLGGLIGLALRVYVSLAVLRGYALARIFLSFVAALALFTLTSNWRDPIADLVAAMFVAAIVLVWLPESNRYFAAVTAARRSVSKG